MITIVSWNIAKQWEPWLQLIDMDADVALLHEAGGIHAELLPQIEVSDWEPWDGDKYDRHQW